MPQEDECRDTSPPTLPEDCLHLFFMVCLSLGWTIEQGDIEAAFLNGEELMRTLILRAPRTGFPAIDGMCDAVAPGTLFQPSARCMGSTTLQISGDGRTSEAWSSAAQPSQFWRLARFSIGSTSRR